MSKGSPIITLRIPADLLADLQVKVAQSVHARGEEPWTLTSWILDAIQEKLAHQERARRQRERLRGKPKGISTLSL